MKKSLLAVITQTFSKPMSSAAIIVGFASLPVASITSLAAEAEKAALVSIDFAKTEQVNPTMWLPANVISRRNSPLSAEQTGQLLWIEEVGTQVSAGQVIARQDNRHLTLRLAQQQAELKQYQADVVYLKKQQQRLSTLNQTNHTALSELERTVKDLAVAINEVDATKLAMEQTKLAIEKSEIKAPFSGSISQRFVDEGVLVMSGSPVLQLVDTHHLDVKIAAPITIAPHIKANDKVLVKWQGELLELPVRTWSLAGDQASRTFDVRLQADGSEMMAGSAVTVSLPKAASKQATLVPRDALVLREQETFIMKIDGQDTAQKISVLVGQGIGQWISVTGNVKAGDEVIIRGGERLQAGQKVRRDEALTQVAAVNQ
ncbi:efflux RND transporter periplasmic adaptor subunit [Thalassotalea euphylliae]|uniref:Efflux RND transporter periplasmic adaptor subunit n=1 Tax=Thalassotalea euphylliae TaxID=1655234 RepID=A0A3E0UFQ8_9GAMM|nr:efflux RND transporter periplasmic adaptor subunit [Thalassotalea euphylliae]REL35848.1 efflux RND transporter periplasmic adaptor subunit [Thalassotalea euphylliae]